jgi:PleD family two-component response regulator
MGGKVHSKKILVVGDVVGEAPFLRAKLVSELAYRGYEVEQCARGVAALAVVRSEKPELVILRFPDWITWGTTLTSLVRADPVLSDTRILNVAPNANAYAVAEAREAGVDATVRSQEPDRIVAEVKQLIGPAVEP